MHSSRVYLSLHLYVQEEGASHALDQHETSDCLIIICRDDDDDIDNDCSDEEDDDNSGDVFKVHHLYDLNVKPMHTWWE